jgi:hypothetical protein
MCFKKCIRNDRLFKKIVHMCFKNASEKFKFFYLYTVNMCFKNPTKMYLFMYKYCTVMFRTKKAKVVDCVIVI